jgi:hypothetical protein
LFFIKKIIVWKINHLLFSFQKAFGKLEQISNFILVWKSEFFFVK